MSDGPARFADSVRAALAVMGHMLIEQPTAAFGGAQAIVGLPKGFAAASGSCPSSWVAPTD